MAVARAVAVMGGGGSGGMLAVGVAVAVTVARVLIFGSTTEPLQRRNGSVVELKIKKSAIPRVHTVGPAICLILFLFAPVTHSLPNPKGCARY
jgi:hypothetical protein